MPSTNPLPELLIYRTDSGKTIMRPTTGLKELPGNGIGLGAGGIALSCIVGANSSLSTKCLNIYDSTTSAGKS